MPKVRKDTDQNAMASGPLNRGIQVKGRLWIEKDGRTYLSWGRIVLLERVHEHGSVAAAAKSMNMSFSHAWRLIEDMNTLAPELLVEKQTGGVRGGGSWLTEAGKRAIVDFWQMVDRFQVWIEDEQL
ncbi:MAG: winged helix-turn-helix domain-containing protein [Desulfobulbus sp.]|jgi:molybdate transport system regulatory protein